MAMKINVLLLISNFKEVNTGRGGHYYSFLETFLNLKCQDSEIEFHALSIGEQSPLPFVGMEIIHVFSSIDEHHISTEKVLEFAKIKGIKVIHAYDYISAEIARRVCTKYKANYIVTKAGGATLKPDIPIPPNLIVFHKNDFTYFKNKKLNKPKALYLMKARASTPSFNSEIKEIFNNSLTQFKLIRICRIGTKYKESIQQAINLVSYLNESGIKAKLVVIGYIEEQEVFDSLNKNEGLVEFNTCDEFTNGASKFIKQADAVIGVGRSVQEALALRKIVFSPVVGQKYPQLLCDENFEIFADNNFSMRVEKKHIDRYLEISDIKTILECPQSIYKLKEWGRSKFESEFDINLATSKLIKIYKELDKVSYKGSFLFNSYSNIWHNLFKYRYELGQKINALFKGYK